MAEHKEEICLRLEVLNPQHQPLGGTVDIACQLPNTQDAYYVHAADASHVIDIRGLRRGPGVSYQVTVKETKTSVSTTQPVSVPALGFNTVQLVLDRRRAAALPSSIVAGARSVPAIAVTPSTLQGFLVMDYGLPAVGVTILLFNIGFGSKDVFIGEGTADANGNYSISYIPPASAANLQVRTLDPTGLQITLSTTKFNASTMETLNLVVPAAVKPLAPEFERLSADLAPSIGGIGALGQAQENASRQDLTLLNQTTNWDARITALGALATQQAQTTGIPQEALYAMVRMGLPSDPTALATVPIGTIQQALVSANSAGIVNLSDDQISQTATAFTGFATTAQLASVTPGAVSNFSQMLAVKLNDSNQQTAFASLYFNNLSPDDFWSGAANIGIPSDTISALKLQGKLLYLTFNNVALANLLENSIAATGTLASLAAGDFDTPATWQTVLQNASSNPSEPTLDSLIPSAYTGATPQDRLAAYAGDLARKVRISYPTEVVARMVERNDLPLSSTTAAGVTSFLRAASAQGYSLGRTPLNAFVNSANGSLPALDADSLEQVKTLHRIFQVTPSSESMQAAVKLGFTSAQQIAAMGKDSFLNLHEADFPPGEARLVYGRSQTISSTTFNICTSAVQMDTSPPVYALSGSSDAKQTAKNALVEQFPSMASLFGNLDYCACSDCQSVLSPAAYFVDVLHFLDQPTSSANGLGYLPLDVLIGKDQTVSGRRPDLGALPLTCENTNTEMPYIDLVNEILEYFIQNQHLDSSLQYDTGTATTADLVAEPQNILPQVYSKTLKNAFFPVTLPFDLWIETVRGFLNYFKTPLVQVLDSLRPVDDLELFGDANNYPYYRAQIFAESLGLSPSDYAVLTGAAVGLTPVNANWFQLYAYPSEAAAISGTAQLEPLSSAKNLAQLLQLTYQELTDLLGTGFLNPSLYSLVFQFQRFGIDIDDAFSYTGQPSYPALTDAAAFKAQLDAITARYNAENGGSTFNAETWLENVLPANYASKVLVLADVDSGCNFSTTTLQYADNATAATPLDFLKFNLFVRLWKKLGWPLDDLDRAMQAFFPANLPAWTDPAFAAAFTAAWKTALVYLAHLDDLNTQFAPAMGRTALLPLWSDLSVAGVAPLYGTLFLTSSVLNNDWAFDDPNGNFPAPLSDLAAALQTFASHQASIQGVLGLTAEDVSAILADASTADTVSVTVNGQPAKVPSFTLNNLSICYRYITVAQCLGLEDVEDLISLRQMSGIDPFQPLSGLAISALKDDVIFNTTLQFVKQVKAVQNSGFSVEDLKYLLRHQFDPVGKYEVDQNAQLTLVQNAFSGLAQIQSQNVLPANLTTLPETLLDQTLSGLFPATILKNLFAVLTDTRSVTASQTGVSAEIDPTPFAAETELSFSYESTTSTQTVTYTGLLLDWKKGQLLTLNTSAEFSSLLSQVQQLGSAAFSNSIGDILGVWASLVEYEAVETGATAALPVQALVDADPALSLSWDAIGQLQWAGYRGVLTDEKKAALNEVAMPSAALATLLSQILNDLQTEPLPGSTQQSGSLAAYTQLVGSLLAMLVNAQTFEVSQTGVAAADEVNATAFFSALSAAQALGTITAPVPALQFSYNAGTQSLSCQGVLTDALRSQLDALPGVSATCTALLQSVRDSMAALFQAVAGSLITVGPADLDIYAGPVAGLSASTAQRQAKANLIEVFLPLLAYKLSKQLVLQTLAGDLSSDPTMTELLVTDTALLSDPSEPGKALLGSFLSLGQAGVSASYFSGGGTTPYASGIAATTDTTDPTNRPPGSATSCHFEGYLQVATDGPYRFFAELGNAGATALLQMDAPAASALLSNPIIPNTAATADHDEISQFVNLQGGVFYHFTLDFASLGANGASLLIQGETLPKGPLSQVVLCPVTSVDDFLRARTLLAKALQIITITSLDEREVSYLVANAPAFGNLRLSSLPTQASDDSPANAVNLFNQMTTLFDYADLRATPAGGTDGLIDVFESVGTSFSEATGSQASNANPVTPWASLANLTRRNAADVRFIGEYFGLIQDVVSGANQSVTAVGDFGNNKGIRRIWQALQLVQVLGIPIAAVTSCTAIVSTTAAAPDQIATNFKNAVKAHYTIDQWRAVAQSVFDPLRQEKRDALVAYLLSPAANLNLDSSNQLFEYFLVDPGMEPVVQTSRLRLAMSSVQTFVQRCLLNLENGNSNQALNISPSAINADWWSWMKRYRVWQANREIFLYPENWMEPEWRTDMTDLFQNLESDLLQGNVTSDLADDAFLNYLNGLEVRSRLDVVATYLDQSQTSTSMDTLHVLARTYSHPHKYFYRTYSNSSWTGWEPVSAKIEGDHVALAWWKGRLNLFWIKYITQANPPSAPGAGGTPITSLGFGDLANNIYASAPQILIQPQLHWCEYFQQKWTDPVASDTSRYPPVGVRTGFTSSQVRIRVTGETNESGGEGALRIVLDFPKQYIDDLAYTLALFEAGGPLLWGYRRAPSSIQPIPTYSFRITSKNCDLNLNTDFYNFPPPNPYSAKNVDATAFTGSASLSSAFQGTLNADGSGATTNEQILEKVNSYAIVPCANPVVPSPFLLSGDLQYQQAGSLVGPIFYKDRPDTSTTDEMSFYIQPWLTESTIEAWPGWALPLPVSIYHLGNNYNPVSELPVASQVPLAGPRPILTADEDVSLFPMQTTTDWVTAPTTAIAYNGTIVGKSGGIGVTTAPSSTYGTAATGLLTVVGKQGIATDHLPAILSSSRLQSGKH